MPISQETNERQLRPIKGQGSAGNAPNNTQKQPVSGVPLEEVVRLEVEVEVLQRLLERLRKSKKAS